MLSCGERVRGGGGLLLYEPQFPACTQRTWPYPRAQPACPSASGAPQACSSQSGPGAQALCILPQSSPSPRPEAQGPLDPPSPQPHAATHGLEEDPTSHAWLPTPPPPAWPPPPLLLPGLSIGLDLAAGSHQPNVQTTAAASVALPTASVPWPVGSPTPCRVRSPLQGHRSQDPQTEPLVGQRSPSPTARSPQHVLTHRVTPLSLCLLGAAVSSATRTGSANQSDFRTHLLFERLWLRERRSLWQEGLPGVG